MRRVLFCFKMPHGEYCGGIAVIIKQYLENATLFEKQGYEVQLFDESQCRKRPANKWGKFENILDLFFQIIAINKKVKQDPNAIIHIHTSRGWTLLKDLILIHSIRKKAKEKIILSIHFAEQDKILMHNILLKKYELTIINNLIDKVIFLSQCTKDEFVAAGLHPNKATVLYTFHNFSPIQPQDGEKNSIKLLFVGSIDKRKGILDLLEVLQLLQKDMDFSLDICGQLNDESIQTDYARLKHCLGKAVVEHGYVTGTAKRTIFGNADILILPSYGEGMPIVIMEAMAASCAIISTNVGAIPEIIKCENGLLIEPGDHNALSQAITNLAKNSDRLTKMKHANYELGKMFGILNNIRNLCNIYKGIYET